LPAVTGVKAISSQSGRTLTAIASFAHSGSCRYCRQPQASPPGLLSYFVKFFEIIILAQKNMTVQEMLSRVQAPRSRHGLRHQLSDVLLMSILAMMSGCQGYRETGCFLDRNRKEFQQSLRLLHMCKGDTKAVDGKSIAGTSSDYFSPYRNFVSMVSVFSAQRDIVLSCSKMGNKKTGEIPAVQQLIRALGIKGELFTLDALHCQKKR
jgi:hypothetical protein